MTILANRRSGSTNDLHAYLIEFDIESGNVEFSARGSGFRRFTLIDRPFLDRWYHVAVVRQNEEFIAYVDGRNINLKSGTAVGDARTTDGISVGGWNAAGSQGRHLFGDVQEVSIYQAFFDQAFISQNMFTNQPVITELKGYFKLGYSTNTTDQLKNFAAAPVPVGTEAATQHGIIEFEETDQAGEQSTFDARRNGGRDSTTPLSGAFAWEQVAFARPTPGVSFDFRFGYSSANGAGGAKLGGIDPYAAGPLGKGWRHTFETRVLPAQTFSPLSDTGTLGLLLWNGALETWDLDNALGEYRPRDLEYRGKMAITTTNCQWTTPEQLVYVFRRPDTGLPVMRGRLSEIHDLNGNHIMLQWDETRGRLTNAIDTAGGVYAFDTNSLLRTLAFGSWQVNFSYDANNRLVSKSITNTSGFYASSNTTWRFVYNNATSSLLESIIDPRGNTNVIVQYDRYGRKTNEIDALCRTNRTEYGGSGKREIRRLDPAGFAWLETYDRKGHILVQRDPLGNETRYTYDDRGNRTSITEPLGWNTLFGYDDRANVIARTNALGEITRWVMHTNFNKAIQQVTPQPSDANGWITWTNFYAYDDAGNLTNHSDALGALVSYTYSTNGLVQTSTDANGRVTTFTYDTNGFLIARTDPASNTTSFVVNDVGWKRVEIDARGYPTTYSYDINGNVVLTVDRISREFTNTYDANGNLLTTSDAMKNVTRYAYDAANQRTNTTDRTGTNTWVTFYNLRGKVERVTDPLGNTITNNYDVANRLTRVMDPLGNSVTNQYDANGNLTVLFDKLGQRWSKTHDRLNRAIAEIDPLGNTRTTTYDIAGRILQTITPNGFPTLHAYDGRGRLTEWQDADGFDWLYDYDGNANITNITDALGGHYVMTYGPRNERTLERNQDNQEWQYTYDELLRLSNQTDPNKLTRTITYDNVGRIRIVAFTSGRQDTYDYDDNNNLRTLSRRASGVSANNVSGFRYDILDRVTQVTDQFYQTVNYGYDALSRVTSLVYPEGKVLQQSYDALNRLTNQIDWAGRQMSYVYDQADRLIRRTYPNGVVQTNAFDNAGRITALSYSASTNNSHIIDLALTYAYDRNGNKTGSGERGAFAWPLPSLSDESSRFTAAGRITNHVDALNPTNRFTYTFDSSGNMTNASGGGQSWALNYDEDNRTTSLLWQSLAITNKLITSRYDALGRRVSRTKNGMETRYVLDLHGNMERILCDTDSGGNFTAWYVYGPDLCYRVDASNNTVCYHADAMANVISMTGTNGANIAQYAYTPYGRILGSTNSQPSTLNSQPFLFIGSQGVMEESPGLYFMRARYYSAEAGVFLSTDPVKKIGPGWYPVAYSYVAGNPVMHIDPSGTEAVGFLDVYSIGKHLQEISSAEDRGLTVVEKGSLILKYGALDGFNIGVGLAFATVGGAMGAAVNVGGFIGNVSTGVEVLADVRSGISSRSGFLFDVGKAVTGTYMASLSMVGNSLGNVLYNNFGIGASGSTVLSSTMAGTTPMVIGNSGPSALYSNGSRSIQHSSTNGITSGGAAIAGAVANSSNSSNSQKGASPSGGSGPTSSGGSYSIRPGDTLGNIAYANGTTATALAQANGIQNPNLIYPGQVITIHRP